MSNTTIWINGFSSTKEKRSAFAVSLSNGNARMDKCYAFGEIAHPANLVSLFGLEFALKAIKDVNTAVELHLANKYVIDMLERDNDGWLKAASANKDVVANIRELLSRFTSFSVVSDKNSDRMVAVRDMARCISDESQ